MPSEQLIDKHKFSLTGNQLKLIAMISMFIDHFTIVFIGKMILPLVNDSHIGAKSTQFLANDYYLWNNMYTVGRCIGRLAFPIFAFLLVEGFVHTGNLIKYSLRLLLFALLSEIPYDLAFSDKGAFFDFSAQNVLFTLLFGLLMLIGFEFVREHVTNLFMSVVYQTLIFMAAASAAYFTRSSYDVMGIAIICAIYFFRYNKKYMWLSVLVAILLTLEVSCMNVSEFLSVVAFVPIAFYNGERGDFRMKYIFYAFYPIHILIFGLIRFFIK